MRGYLVGPAGVCRPGYMSGVSRARTGLVRPLHNTPGHSTAKLAAVRAPATATPASLLVTVTPRTAQPLPMPHTSNHSLPYWSLQSLAIRFSKHIR